MKYILLFTPLVMMGFSIVFGYELFIVHNPLIVEVYTNNLFLEILWLSSLIMMVNMSIRINGRIYSMSDRLVKAIALITIGLLMIVKLTYIL